MKLDGDVELLSSPSVSVHFEIKTFCSPSDLVNFSLF